MKIQGMDIDSPEWREVVRKDEPEGDNCGWCGKVNDFWDDCGWFYVTPGGKDTKCAPCCKSCWHGEPGTKHVERYGLGER